MPFVRFGYSPGVNHDTTGPFDPRDPGADAGRRPGPHDAYGPQDDVPGRAPGYGAGPGFEPRRGGGLRGFPFPHYSTRTKRGTQVTVGGCCLPLPIGCLMLTLTAGGVAVSRLVRSRS